MKARQHRNLLLQALTVWLLFFLIGLPDYYQQYPDAWLGVASVLLQVGFSLASVLVLVRVRAEHRMSRACWISFYYTVPLALMDTWYCGIHLGHGSAYLWKYWYLTVFYIAPWLSFPPTAWLLDRSGPSIPARTDG